MHVNLGKPYENIISKAIKEGYATNSSEVLRQALMNYKEKLEEEYKQDYLEKIDKIDKGKFVKVSSTKDLWSN